MFEPVDARVDFPSLESETLERWQADSVFSASLTQREAAPRFTFYEGPPTANNKPGLHHVWARIFKDVFCRFKTMRGFLVERKGGWDCHGLPVELEIEKELGISSKDEIEAFGVEEFNSLCRESVRRYVSDWEELTRRIGFWIDTENAYWTMSDEYVESVWWHLGRMWDADLLYEDAKVVPYCPRCGTALSSHEVAQGYEEIEDLSAYVKFPLVGEEATSLLVWTTTPWTLVSNVAVAAHPEATYVKVAVEGENLVLAKALLAEVFGENPPQVVAEFPGSDLSGSYERPFTYIEAEPTPAYTVVHADFVTMDEGTGLVHLAPAFGEIDREVGREYGLPAPNPVNAEGRFDGRVGEHAGVPVRDANAGLVEELRASGRLFRAEPYTHSYPHCWRCSTPLIYWAKSSWYVKTTSRRDRMIEENQRIGWHPAHIRDGRFGDWLANNIDWSLSRDRYWGTPLPIWQCENGHSTFVRSRSELGELAGRDLSALDPHRPFIDEISFDCPQCQGESAAKASRIAPVIDAWFDSGSMPAAQWGYPRGDASAEEFDRAYPADFICEAIDQTRGWFYSLLAVSTLTFDQASYKNVLCLGHIVDSDGKKMSKSLGNIIDPWTILDRIGADPLRWFFFSSGSPWTSSRVSVDAVEKSISGFLLTFWNTYSFFVTYANADSWSPGDGDQVPLNERPLLDQWALARLTATQSEVTEAMESYDALSATRALSTFISDLSNWYVRRSRRRFWAAREAGRAGGGVEKEAAYQTLYECLVTASTLLAPFCPFISDAIHRNLVPDGGSVHLADWPEIDPGRRQPGLEDGVEAARKIVSLGRAARTESKVRIRQPLGRALLVIPDGLTALIGDELEAVIREELNVDHLEPASTLADLVEVEVRPDFAKLGPRLGKQVQAVGTALAEASSGDLASEIEAGRRVEIEVEGETISLAPDELEVRRAPREGFAVVSEAGFGVALDLEIDERLRLRGIARELTHTLQGFRKSSGLDVADRIRLGLIAPAGGSIEAAIRAHGDEIADELLATSLAASSLEDESASRATFEIDGETVTATLAVA